MKKRATIIGLVVISFVSVGFFTLMPVGQFFVAFVIKDVTRDPLVKRIETDAAQQDSRWGVQIEHDIRVFGKELDRVSVENRLLQSGFSPAAQIGQHYESRRIGEFSYGTGLHEALISGLPCQKKFFIFLWFDDADKLAAVKSAQFEAGCL